MLKMKFIQSGCAKNDEEAKNAVNFLAERRCRGGTDGAADSTRQLRGSQILSKSDGKKHQTTVPVGLLSLITYNLFVVVWVLNDPVGRALEHVHMLSFLRGCS